MSHSQYLPHVDDELYQHPGVNKNKFTRNFVLCFALFATLVLATIVTAVIVIVSVYYAKQPSWDHKESFWSNRDTLLVITIDGFRNDYLSVLTPECYSIITKLINGGMKSTRAGVTAEVYPVFPSKPSVNLASLVTGTYPKYHGILNKNVYDETQKGLIFSMETADATPASVWQKMEPIWVTLAKKNRTTLVQYVPGSNAEIGGYKPTYYNKTFDKGYSFKERINDALAIIDGPEKNRPDFLMLHTSVSNVARQYGPFGKDTIEVVRKVDLAIGYLVDELEKRNIAQYIDIAVVSVTGTSQIKDDGVLYLEDIYAAGLGRQPNGTLNPSPFYFEDGESMFITDYMKINNRGVVLDLYPTEYDDEADKRNMIDFAIKMLEKAKEVDAKFDHFSIYYKDNLPSEWNYKLDADKFENDYTPYIIIVADQNYMITTKDKAYYGQQGDDGYYTDGKNATFNGVFVANGPHFRSDASNAPTGVNVVDMHELFTTILSTPASNYNKGKGMRASYVLDPLFVQALNGTSPPVPPTTKAPDTTYAPKGTTTTAKPH